MKKIFFSTILLVLCAAVIKAQEIEIAVPSPTPEISAKSAIRGRVYYADNGRPVRRASIMLLRADGMSGGPSEFGGITDSQGYFEIRNLRAGAYFAMVNAPGVVSPLAYADLSKPPSNKDAFQNASSEFERIIVNGINNIEVQIPAVRGGAISGRVSYDDGDIAVGVKVEILRKVEDKWVQVVPNMSSIFSMLAGSGGQTDDRGFYRFPGLPFGEYIVKVTENVKHTSSGNSHRYDAFSNLFGASSFVTIYYPDVSTADEAQKISVNLGSEMQEINITIPSRTLYHIQGKVIAAKDKSPLKNAKVTLKRAGTKDNSLFGEMSDRQNEDRTDESGNWSFNELPKGNYEIIVEPPGEYPSMDEIGEAANSVNVSIKTAPPKPKLSKKVHPISIENENLSNMVIELGFGASIYGTVAVENSQEMPTNVSISVNFDDNEQLTSSTGVYNYSDPEAEAVKISNDFKLEGIAAGSAKLLVVAGENFYVKSVTLYGSDLLVAPLELKEGDIKRNVKIVLGKDLGTLKGKVLDENKQPVKFRRIFLAPTESAKSKILTAQTDENGEFETKLPPFEYAVIFEIKPLQDRKPEEIAAWHAEAIKNAQKVTIKPRETVTISLVLPKP